MARSNSRTDNCKYEHPRSGTTTFGSNNRFGALSNPGNPFNRNQNLNNSKTPEWSIQSRDIDQIRIELGKERPKWILTTYSATKNTPGSLFEGNEFSPEEVRQRFYDMASKGQEAQADQEASQLWSKAEQDMNQALDRASDIPKFMEDCQKKHPNRYDFLQFDGTKSRDDFTKSVESSQNITVTPAFGTGGGGFGQTSTNNSNPFSKPAAATFGQPAGPSAFGASAFGKPAPTSAFGQSGFGSSGNSAFGKPAFSNPGFGQSSFGQPSQPAQPAQTTSAFGQTAQTTAFGQSSFGSATTGFGKPAQPSTFGKPTQTISAFGQPSQPTSTFGQGALGQNSSPFGQPSKPGGFGQSSFGQMAQPSTSTAFGVTPQSNSAFGLSGTTTAFGQQSAQAGSNLFGMKADSTSVPEVSMDSESTPVTQPTQTALSNSFTITPAVSNPFNTQATFGNASTTPATTGVGTAISATNTAQTSQTSQTSHLLTGKPPAPLTYTQSLPQGPTQISLSKQLSTYRGQQVQYLEDTSTTTAEGTTVPCFNRPDGKGPEKIWFPEASATVEVASLTREEKANDLQPAIEKYSESIKAVYKVLFETGKFEAGKLPSIPPMRDWIAYDF